jgi:hypothetical protein
MFSMRRVVSAVDRTWENVYPTFSSSLDRHSYLSKRLHTIPYTCGLSITRLHSCRGLNLLISGQTVTTLSKKMRSNDRLLKCFIRVSSRWVPTLLPRRPFLFRRKMERLQKRQKTTMEIRKPHMIPWWLSWVDISGCDKGCSFYDQNIECDNQSRSYNNFLMPPSLVVIITAFPTKRVSNATIKPH